MTLSAILRDSMREVLDARTTKVLIALSTAILAVCLSFKVERRTPEDTLRAVVADLELPVALKGRKIEPEDDPRIRVESIRPVTEADHPGPEFRGGYRMLLSVGNPEAFAQRVKAAMEENREPNARDGEMYLMDRFARAGVPLVKAFVVGETLRFYVTVQTPEWDEVDGGARVWILFGSWEWPLNGVSLAHALIRIQLILTIFVAGGAWIWVALVWTAGSIPTMLARGSADLVLAKPVGRVSLLLYKFLGGLLFVTLHGTYLIGTTWAALAWRFGWWNPGYLGSILLVIGWFAILYSVSVLAGVVSRSVVAPILAPTAVWFWCWLLWVERVAEEEGRLMQVPDKVSRLLHILYLLSPRTGDLNSLTTWFVARGRTSPTLLRDFDLDRALDLTLILGSSGAFVLLVLALACCLFSRRDY